jgi:hypothetical protein
MGCRLKRVQKTKPLKKIKEVDEIFENVNKENRESDENSKSLRISINTKSHFKLGEFSRNGKARDHDMKPSGSLVPGILDVLSPELAIIWEHRMKQAISSATVLNYGGNKTKKNMLILLNSLSILTMVRNWPAIEHSLFVEWLSFQKKRE